MDFLASVQCGRASLLALGSASLQNPTSTLSCLIGPKSSPNPREFSGRSQVNSSSDPKNPDCWKKATCPDRTRCAAQARRRSLTWQAVETFNLLARSGSRPWLNTIAGRGVSTHREKRMRVKMDGPIAAWDLQPIHSRLGAGGGNRINWERPDSNL
jgi:hypothetical protein